MNKVDKIVNKILNHYGNLNKLEDLQKILKENKKVESPKVIKKDTKKVTKKIVSPKVTKKVESQKVTKNVKKSSLIFSCNNQNDSCDNNSNDNESCNNPSNYYHSTQFGKNIKESFDKDNLSSEQKTIKEFIKETRNNSDTSLILVLDKNNNFNGDWIGYDLFFNYKKTGLQLLVRNESKIYNKEIFTFKILYFFEHTNFIDNNKNYILLDSFNSLEENTSINFNLFNMSNKEVDFPFLKINLNSKLLFLFYFI